MNREGLVRKVKVKLGSRNHWKGSDAKCAVVERPLSTESCSLWKAWTKRRFKVTVGKLFSLT